MKRDSRDLGLGGEWPSVQYSPRGSIKIMLLAAAGAAAIVALILALLFLMGCEKAPAPPPGYARMLCDYCGVERERVSGYKCESCNGMHFSCPIEMSMLNCMSHWTCWITACPKGIRK